MKTQIGSKYFEKSAELRQNIKTRTANIFEAADWEKACCYFCRKPIKGKIRVVKEINVTGENYYPIDKRCYANIIGIKVIQ